MLKYVLYIIREKTLFVFYFHIYFRYYLFIIYITFTINKFYLLQIIYIYLLISSKSLFNPCFLKKNGKKYENLRKLFNLVISMQIIHKKLY